MGMYRLQMSIIYLNYIFMKTKFLGAIIIVAIAVVTAFNLNINTEVRELSDLTRNNVEALAGGEVIVEGLCRQTASTLCMAFIEDGYFLLGERVF